MSWDSIWGNLYVMRVALAMIVVLLWPAVPAFAQEHKHDSDESIEIQRPADGAEVSRPFVMEGTAPRGAVLELLVDGEFRGVHRANDRGRFLIPVDWDAERVGVRIRGGEVSAEVTVRVEGARVREVPDRDPEEAPGQVDAKRESSADTTSNAAADPADSEEPTTPEEREKRVRAAKAAKAGINDAVIEGDILSAQVFGEELVAADASVASETDSDEGGDPFRAADSIDPFAEADRQVEEIDDGMPEWDRWNAGVMLAQTLIGTAVGLGFGGGMYLLLAPGMFVAAIVIGAIVGILALVGSVQALGAGWGGTSPWGYALMGALAGILAGVAFPPLVLLLPGLGATVGYHLKSKQREPSE